MDRLKGKLALVTGGGSGIGAAIARRFHGEGARVVVNDLRPDAAQSVAREVDGTALVADVADAAQVRRMFDEVGARFGRLDVLVNNAGIAGLEGGSESGAQLTEVMVKQAMERMSGGPLATHLDVTMNLSDADWRRMLAVHLDGTFYCSREALKLMAAQGSGVILNMGSIMGTAGGAGAPHYCAAKAGILGFTRALAREVVTRGIRVNALAPGWIQTPFIAPLEAGWRFIAGQTPMNRLGEPDDIAWAAVYLASDEAKFVTGQVLSPNGGWVMNQ